MPEDAEIQTDRAVGSSIRMFSFETGENAEDLMQDWTVKLEENGYSVREQSADLGQSSIEFSGADILNAKIVPTVNVSSDNTLISFDATLE